MLGGLIAACVFTGYFVESVFGFGGTILSLALVSSMVDIKDAILIVTYASMCCSVFVLLSDPKSFSFKHLTRIYTFALPGVLLGTFLMTVMNSALLLKVFAVFLVAYSLYSFFKPRFALPFIVSRFLLFCGGVIQGIYATGGPFTLMAYGHEFENKSSLRAVMAAYFLFGNIVRLIQLQFMGKLNTGVFFEYWWIALPIAAAVYGGFMVHLKINDKIFQYGILVLMLVAGVFYLFK